MNFPISSFRSFAFNPAGIAVPFVLLLTAQASAVPICQDPTAAPAGVVVDLKAVGDDLEAEFKTDPALGPVTVALWLDESTLLASTTVPVSSAGFASVVMPGILAGSETREIRYHLEASDTLGDPLMEPYPFLLLFDCFGACVYHLIPGMWTDALVVTEHLADTLAGLPPCDLLANLQGPSSGGDPELRMGAQTLAHQVQLRGLDSLPANGCRYAWQTVIPIRLGFWDHVNEATLSADGSYTTSQNVSWQSGANAYFALQGTSLNHQPTSETYPPPGNGQLPISMTRVEQSIICLQSGTGCLSGPCQGDVEVELDFDRCLITEAMVCNPQSTATATAEHAMYYQVKEDLIIDQSPLISEVTACQGARCDGGWPMVWIGEAKHNTISEVSTPVVVSLTGETRISYLSEGRGRDGATYSLTESSFEYELTLKGSASCTENETSEIFITAPATTKDDPDGLRMRRWWPDEEPRGVDLPASAPPSPEICRDPIAP